MKALKNMLILLSLFFFCSKIRTVDFLTTMPNGCTEGVRGANISRCNHSPFTNIVEILKQFPPSPLKQYSIKVTAVSHSLFPSCISSTGWVRCSKNFMFIDNTFRCMPGDRLTFSAGAGEFGVFDLYLTTTDQPYCAFDNSSIFAFANENFSNCTILIEGTNDMNIEITTTDYEIPSSGLDSDIYYECENKTKLYPIRGSFMKTNNTSKNRLKIFGICFMMIILAIINI